MDKLDAAYWSNRYEEQNTGWDAGKITTPLKAYADQLKNHELKILIPGAGTAHEATYLFENGFHNVYVLDWSPEPLKIFQSKNPDFPAEQLIHKDFFELNRQFDLVIEQTFFCALDPELRPDYVRKMYEILKPDGLLVGLLWNSDFPSGPPFGGTIEEYNRLFSPYFDLEILEDSYNSIKPRAGREVFIKFRRKA